MTIAAGLVCEDGIVLCADSQESAGQFKWPVEKLTFTQKFGYPVIVAGAGFGPAIDNASQRILARLEGGYDSPDANVDHIQTILRDIHENDLENHPLGKEVTEFQLLIAFYVKGYGAYLYHTSGSLVNRVKYFQVIGSGAIVNYFAHSLYRKNPFNRPDIGLSEGKTLAAYLAYLAKTQLSTVGGRSVLLALDGKGEIGYASEWEIPQWERFFSEFQWLQGQLMLDTVHPGVSSADYAQVVDDFAAKMKERKLKLLEETQQWEDIFRPFSAEELGNADAAMPSDSQTPEDQQ